LSEASFPHSEKFVSVLFNEPKLLKFRGDAWGQKPGRGFSALQRAEIAEMSPAPPATAADLAISVLFNEPKLLKSRCGALFFHR